MICFLTDICNMVSAFFWGGGKYLLSIVCKASSLVLLDLGAFLGSGGFLGFGGFNEDLYPKCVATDVRSAI